MNLDLQALVERAIEQEEAAPSGSKGSKKPDPPRTPVEAKDTLRSRAYAQVVDLLSEGEIEGLQGGFKGITFDGTPVQNDDNSFNFKDVVYEETKGTPFQDFLSGTSLVEREISLGVELKKNFPVVRTIDNDDVDAIRVKIKVEALYSQDPKTGDTNGSSVRVDVYLQGGNDTNYVLAQAVTISGKSSGPYERQVTLQLNGPGPWRVKFERATADSTTNTLQNKTVVSGFTEVVYAKLRYPYSALVGMSFDAEQFPQIPERGFLIKGLKIRVPANYNPVTRSYSGLWDGSFKTAWTNNPAWCFYDLLTNKRYGLGRHVSDNEIDKWQLYEIARYCDALVDDGAGGTEPRFTMNTYIQTRQEAFTLLRSMASVFRAMLFWSGSQVFLSQDRPADHVWQYTNANVLDGEFSYNSTHENVRHTVVYVSYNNPDDNYKLDKVYVDDEEGIKRYGVNETEVTAWGCTSRGQAIRFGRWLLYTELSETDVVSFKCSLDALRCYPGSLIKVNDSLRLGTRMGGRLVGFTSQGATLDAEVTIDGSSTYTFSWLSKAGKLVSRPLPFMAPGQYKQVSWTSPVMGDDLPVDLGIWTLSASTLASRTYRVASIREEDMVFTVTAVEHNEFKFDQIEKGIVTNQPPVVRQAKPSKPVRLALSEELYVSGEALKVSMALSVDYHQDAVSYTFSYRRDNGNWTITTSPEPTLQVNDILTGVYEVKCYVTNILKLKSAEATLTATVLGKAKPPADVTGLAASLTTSGITLTWDSVPDLDLDGYEVRVGSSWAAGEVVAFAKSTTVSWVPPAPGLLFTFHVRAKDTSGNMSKGVTTLATQFSRPADVGAFSVVQLGGRLRFKWSRAERAAFYEVRCGESFELGEPLFRVADLNNDIEWGRLGEKYFWIKGVDYIGNTSEVAIFTSMETSQPSGRNQLLKYDFDLLNWPGSFYNMDSVGGDLELSDGTSYGEYYYSIELDKTFKSIVTLDYNLQALLDSNLTWLDMDFTWDSQDADIPWAEGGDFGSVGTETYISYRTAITASVVVSFRLNGELVSLDGLVSPSYSTGVSYAPCRYADGLVVGETTKVVWQKSLPATFSKVLTLRFQDFAQHHGLVVLRDSLTGHQIRLVYKTDTKRLVCENNFGGAEISIPLEAKVGEIITVGLSQNAVSQTRNLFAQRLGYAHTFASAPAPTLPNFTDIALNGHFL